MYEEFELSFQFRIHEGTAGIYQNILRLGIGDPRNIDIGKGSRVPGVWLGPRSTEILIATNLNGNLTITNIQALWK